MAHATWHTFSPSIFSYLHQIILFLFSLHILLSICLHRSLNYYVSVLPRACTWVYKQANFSQKSLSPLLLHRLQLLLSSLHFTTACCLGPGFAEEELLFFLEVPCPFDHCCSCTALLVSTKRTAAICFSWQGPDHCSRTCSLTHCQCRRNILIAIVIYLAAFWLPKSLDYSGHAIQVHTQECAIQLHTQEHAIQVHSILVHHYVLSYTTRTRALLSNPVHYSCTAMYSRAPLVHVHHSYTCTTRTRAQLVLVHHSVLVHRSVISCTTHALLCTLVHPSRAAISCTTPTRAPLVLVHHSVILCTARAPLHNLVHHRAPLVLVHHSAISCTTA